MDTFSLARPKLACENISYHVSSAACKTLFSFSIPLYVLPVKCSSVNIPFYII
jgi:hypothetical protein